MKVCIWVIFFSFFAFLSFVSLSDGSLKKRSWKWKFSFPRLFWFGSVAECFRIPFGKAYGKLKCIKKWEGKGSNLEDYLIQAKWDLGFYQGDHLPRPHCWKSTKKHLFLVKLNLGIYQNARFFNTSIISFLIVVCRWVREEFGGLVNGDGLSLLRDPWGGMKRWRWKYG